MLAQPSPIGDSAITALNIMDYPTLSPDLLAVVPRCRKGWHIGTFRVPHATSQGTLWRYGMSGTVNICPISYAEET